MDAREGEPTRDQLMAMAYVDGELDANARREFEALLSSRVDLQKEVAGLQRLQVLAREMAAPEPMDHEWERLRLDPIQRAGFGIGYALLLIGSVAIIGWVFVGVALSDEIDIAAKLIIYALVLGGVVLLLATLRARLRTLPYDPYTEIQR